MKALFLLLTLAVTACGTTNDQLSVAQDHAVSNETVKLYKEPGHKVVNGCDVFTQITLKSETGAFLTNRLEGNCKILVTPEPRSYTLQVTNNECGSRVLTGDSRGASIEIVDNRTRVCKDAVAAMFVVTERIGQETTTYYGYSHEEQAARTLTGTLVAVAGIGGESTGTALQLADGSIVEIDLATNNLAYEFQTMENQAVQIIGVETVVRGVEIPERHVLVIQSIELL